MLPQRVSDCQKKLQLTAAALCNEIFDRSNKFDLCYYGQVINPLWLKSSVASKWEVNTFGGNIYFAGDGTLFFLFNLQSYSACKMFFISE